ncbi:unnamed protein product, partial [Trichobilharzia regenti]
TSHPSLQSKSKPPTPSAGSTIRPVDQPFHATGDHLIDLWGPPAGDTFKVPPVPSHKINRRVLGQHTKNSSVPKVPETDILRELLFVLSGGGGNLVKFKDSPDSFELVISPNISDSQKDAVQKIAICGWLHNAIQHWMRSAQSNRFGGVILQCFTTGLHEHMTEYYGLLARLEVSQSVGVVMNYYYFFGWMVGFLFSPPLPLPPPGSFVCKRYVLFVFLFYILNEICHASSLKNKFRIFNSNVKSVLLTIGIRNLTRAS